MATLLAFAWLLLLQTEPRFERLMRDLLIFDAHIDTPRYR